MKNILITGSRGLLGNNLKNLLISNEDINIITPSSRELNLLNSAEVNNFFDTHEVDSVIHCASLVGGILFNIEHQYEMAVKNSLINMNVLNNCVNKNIERLITIGSSCCYPIDAQQPFEEASYGPGKYESTNSNYALSKIIMSEAIEALHEKSDLRYKTIIMCNLFGHQEKEDTNHYHLINAIADKCKTALQKKSKAISIGGSGSPRREFLDAMSAAKFVQKTLYEYEKIPSKINCGYYTDHSVIEYYDMICSLYKIHPEYEFDRSMPDGVPTKKMNIDKALQLGWEPCKIEDSLRSFIKQKNV